ncbi:MAG TPA: HAD-IA family hydrolase [Casimicrobiaceae bacterium]|nr:HAD-IA family hydrolase [Casimicrobiaceae bacterium]
MPVRAVLFDLDGTLADTAADLGNALNRVRADRALPPLPLATLRPQASHGARGLLAAGFGIGKEHADFAPLRDAFLAYYAEALCEHTTLFPEAERVLAEIERRGLRWGIVTNKAARFTVPVVERLALAARAGAVICGDTTAQSKPHPAPLLAGAAALAVEPGRCVYVGDAERDIIAGRAAGMRTLFAAYGYVGADETPAAWNADGELGSLPELLDWLPLAADMAAA